MYTEFVGTISCRSLFRAVTTLLPMVMLSTILVQRVAAAPHEAKVAPLLLDEIVDNLVRKNAERSRNLLHCQATRVYHLTYRGFPGNREAEMTVEANFQRPTTKDFKIISQSGSKLILDRV